MGILDEEIQLTEEQQAAVEHGEGPLLIVAGAGTGKTLVITHRIAYLIRSKIAKPEEILALTFTEKAAAEMTARVDVLVPYGFSAVPISTFHAFGDRILREFGFEMGMDPEFRVLSQSEQTIFFREHLFEFPLKRYLPLSNPTRFIQAILKVISRAKDEDISPEEYIEYVRRLKEKGKEDSSNDELQEEAVLHEEIAGTYAKYQELLRKYGFIDFGDQVFLTLRLLRTSSRARQELQRRYKYILVDEFQDTNYAQFQLIQLLGGEKANITVVGDDDQSIYKFRGAAISNILQFMEIYPNAKQIVLTQNFRSTQLILDTAYRLIQHNNPDRLEVKNRINKRLKALRVGDHPVEHLHFDTLTSEADGVAQKITELLETKRYTLNDFAILVRSNADADPFLRSLNMRGIPWRFSGNRGLYSKPEVQLLIAFLKVLADVDDSLHLYHLATSSIYELRSMAELNRCANIAHRQNRSLFWIFSHLATIDELADLSSETKATIQKIIEDIQRYLELSRDNPTGVVLYQFLVQSGFLKRLSQSPNPEDGVKIQNMARFFEVIRAFSQTATVDRVIHFVRYLDLLMEAGDDPGTAELDADFDAVNVMTVHQAKGLEWPVVFMVGLVHQRFPHVRRSDPIELPDALVREVLPQGDAHLQEERRLFYVGMTRAKERLFLTSGLNYGGVRPRKVSPFVLEALDRPHADTEVIRKSAEERIHQFAPPPEGIIETMSPIPENHILTLSHWQVDDYCTCPLKYKYVHVLRVPILPHHSVIYGEALHKVIQVYHERKIHGIPVTLEDLYRVFEANWKNIGFLSREHEERRFQAGKEAIQQFFEQEEARGITPMLVEARFSFVFENNRIEGRWDRVDNRDGEIVIVDFKSSEVYQQEDADRRTGESLQLGIYALAYLKVYQKMPDKVELHFLGSGLIGQMDVTEKMLEKAQKAIEEAAQGIRRHDYTPRPSFIYCPTCAYADICPSAIRKSAA